MCHRKRILLFIFLGFCAIAFTQAQPSPTLKPAGYFYQLTRVLLRDGSVKLGWFVGTDRDSMVIHIGGRSERVSHQDLLRVVIEVEGMTERRCMSKEKGPVGVGAPSSVDATCTRILLYWSSPTAN